MTTVELAEATRSEVERLRTAMHDHGLTGEGVRAAMQEHGLTGEGIQAATERVAAAAESHGSDLRNRLAAAARDRARRAEERRASRRRLPRGLRATFRVMGAAWAALMLATLTMAFLSRASTRRAPAADPDSNEIRIRTDLGPMAFTSRAAAFKRGDIDCWYGGGFVDLRDATLDPAGALLRVRAVFGGGQIIVPDGWRVVSHVRGIGGLTDLRPAVERGVEAPVLTIEGIVVFGGFSIESTIAEKTRTGLEKAVAEMHAADREAEPVAV